MITNVRFWHVAAIRLSDLLKNLPTAARDP